MNLIKRIINVLLKPKEEFLKVKKEENIKQALVYLLPLGLFFTIIQLIIGLPEPITRYINTNTAYVVTFLISLIIIYAMVFIDTGLLYLILKYFKHREHFKDTFNAMSYGMTPYLLLGWMPLVGILALLYTMYLQIVGIREVLRINLKKAVISYSILAGIYILIFGVLALI